MRPVLQTKTKLSRRLWVLYALIFIICLVGIGIALYLLNYKSEVIETPFGEKTAEVEKQDEDNDLKKEFDDIFTNDIEIIQQGNLNIEKIHDEYNIVATPYKYEKNEENLSINVSIPYINIKNNSAIQFNKEITSKYKNRAETLLNQVSSLNIVYSVEYKAYKQNNILSLAIRSQFKEGSKSQKIVVETFNYNFAENREATIDELLKLKNINKQDATEKIRNEIKKVQEQWQPLIEQGYNVYARNYQSNIYDISNVQEFLYGKDGRLYVIYPYGNEEDTSEMDIIIF